MTARDERRGARKSPAPVREWTDARRGVVDHRHDATPPPREAVAHVSPGAGHRETDLRARRRRGTTARSHQVREASGRDRRLPFRSGGHRDGAEGGGRAGRQGHGADCVCQSRWRSTPAEARTPLVSMPASSWPEPPTTWCATTTSTSWWTGGSSTCCRSISRTWTSTTAAASASRPPAPAGCARRPRSSSPIARGRVTRRRPTRSSSARRTRGRCSTRSWGGPGRNCSSTTRRCRTRACFER